MGGKATRRTRVIWRIGCRTFRFPVPFTRLKLIKSNNVLLPHVNATPIQYVSNRCNLATVRTLKSAVFISTVQNMGCTHVASYVALILLEIVFIEFFSAFKKIHCFPCMLRDLMVCFLLILHMPFTLFPQKDKAILMENFG